MMGATRHELRELNVGIGVAERDHDTGFLREVLDERLIFRRADGKVVGKDDYLSNLATRTYESLDVEVVEVDETSDSAVVTAIATASGTSNGKPFGGTFRNVRTFVGGHGAWRCTLWINTRVGTGAAALHHVTLPVTDPERSRRFYREIVGLREIPRPAFPFPGAWFGRDMNQLQRIVREASTFRRARSCLSCTPRRRSNCVSQGNRRKRRSWQPSTGLPFAPSTKGRTLAGA
jgi:hypothetical protein